MKSVNRLTLLLALLFLVTCAYAQDVHYDYDRGANFGSYKTYQWVDADTSQRKVEPPNGLPKLDLPGGGPPNLPAGGPLSIQGGTSDDQLIRQDIERAIDEQLAQKGLTKVEKDGDLLVAYHAAIREEKSINLNGMAWGDRGWGGWGGWGGYGGMLDASINGQTSTIPIGTLVVDLYDPARKQLVWRGEASKTIDVKRDPDKNYKNLQKAMAKLFRKYPPPPGK